LWKLTKIALGTKRTKIYLALICLIPLLFQGSLLILLIQFSTIPNAIIADEFVKKKKNKERKKEKEKERKKFIFLLLF